MELQINKKYFCKKSLDFYPSSDTNQKIINGNYYEIISKYKDYVVVFTGEYYEPMNIHNYKIVGFPWDFYDYFDTEKETRNKKLNKLKNGINT